MRADRKGFTLLEVMVALGIFGIVTTTLYGTFARTLRSKGLAERRAEITRLGRAAVNRMADEIGSAYYPTAGKDTGFFRALKSGTEDAPLDSLMFTALSSRPAGLDGRGTDQRMLTYFFPRDRSAMRRGGRSDDKSGAQETAFTSSGLGSNPRRRDVLADDADDFFAAFGPSHPPVLGTTPRRLLRREATVIERDALDDARATVFLEDVASLELTFFNGRDWRDTWDSEDRETPRLPRAVRIDLALYDDTGEVQHFVSAVDVPLSDTPITSGSGTAATATPRPQRTSSAGVKR